MIIILLLLDYLIIIIFTCPVGQLFVLAWAGVTKLRLGYKS